MKKINLFATLTLCIGSIFVSSPSFANSYFPPERIQCDNLGCYGFDGKYLAINGVIDTRSFPRNKVTLHFVTGEAATKTGPVKFTYESANKEMSVWLTNSTPNIKPDFTNPSNWYLNGANYICDSYMTCALTDN